MTRRCLACPLLWLAIAALLALSPELRAYGVLAHQAIIDAAWDSHVRPLLLERFPNATPEELRKAHAYTYGGAIIQDLGYYPHGSHTFSNLLHYVRSGDFVQALLREARDLNEYAFALGALAHYSSDNEGHRIAVNRAVPLLYPHLAKKYGDEVTYEDDPAAHLKTEFGFDVLEVAKERFAPDSYHDFIGFEVAKALLERAFQDTYCLPLRSVYDDFDKAIGSYRYSVRSVIPRATKVAWALKKDEIQQDLPGMTRKRFLYNLSRASYEQEWGRKYQKPSLGDHFLAFLFQLIPKIGPLKALTFRTPTPETERLFEASFNSSLEEYQRHLINFRAGNLELPNRNFDTGRQEPPGAYFITDQTYAHLVDLLAGEQFKQISAALREDILAYYRDKNVAFATKKKAKDWARVTQEVENLRALTLTTREIWQDSDRAGHKKQIPLSSPQ